MPCHLILTFRRTLSLLALKVSLGLCPSESLFPCHAAEKLLRTDPVEDKEGFFIALFVKEHVDSYRGSPSGLSTQKTNRRVSGSTKKRFVTGTKLSRLLFYSSGMQTKTT